MVTLTPAAQLRIGAATKIVRAGDVSTLLDADAVLASARAAALQIEAEALRTADIRCAQAYELGLAQGRSDGRAAALADTAAHLEQYFDRLFDDQGMLTDILADAFDALFDALDAGERLRRFVARAMADAAAVHGRLRVFVNPAQAVAVEPLIAAWNERHPRRAAQLVSDAALGVEAYRIEGGAQGAGWVVADDLGTAVAALKRALCK